MQEKYDKSMSSLTEMEKRVKVAESMLEATLQYESGQAKALKSPRYMKISVSRMGYMIIFCTLFSSLFCIVCIHLPVIKTVTTYSLVVLLGHIFLW